MKPLKYLGLILAALLLAFAAFYFYEPALSEETKAWLARADREVNEAQLAEIKSLSWQYSVFESYRRDGPCVSDPFGGECFHQLLTGGELKIDPRKRRAFRELIQLYSVAVLNYAQGPSYQHILAGSIDDFYRDIELHGMITADSLIFNLTESKRFIGSRGTLLEKMIAAAHRHNTLCAVNLGLGAGTDLDASKLAELLEPSLVWTEV